MIEQVRGLGVLRPPHDKLTAYEQQYGADEFSRQLKPILESRLRPTAPPEAQQSQVAGRWGDKTVTLDLGEGVTMELVLIPAGEFRMGSPESEEERSDNEGPQHMVRITKPFYIGKYEVTQAQWQAVMGNNPSRFKGDDLPVEKVSWHACQEFCGRLSRRCNRRIRLPTEAEWEYACRSGTTTPYTWGASKDTAEEYTWHFHNSGEKTHVVGTKKPTPWGLYDMHGNVEEWCQDGFYRYLPHVQSDPMVERSSDEWAVIRGSSWHGHIYQARSAHRWGYMPKEGAWCIGLRVVCENE